MQAILKLSRWQESIPFVIPLTLLGGLMAYRFADVRLDERLLYVLLANILAVIYAFMINDIEDAEDDQKGDPERAKRNVIASGELSKGDGWMASVGAALLALILYTLSGAYALYAGFIILDLGHLYSWKPIRLKALPVLDIVSHVLMLSALLLLAAYFVYDTAPGEVWLLVVSMTLISAYGQLYNQLRDFEADRAAGLHNTASLLGKSLTEKVGYGVLMIALVCLLLTILKDAFPFELLAVVLISIQIVRLAARGQDMRGDTASDAIGDLQVQFLLSANIVLIVWLIYVYINP